ncbi:MAG: alginate export family protein [Sedimentisphaerales bacterium]|nr:alginate export family protein [Sedimentisphaerales bacterium]
MKINLLSQGGRIKSKLLAMVIAVLGGWTAEVFAQVEGTQAERILDEPFRLKMDASAPAGKRAVVNWGGWFRSSFWDIDDNLDLDGDGRNDGRHTLRRQQLRLYGDINLDQVHQFYVRGRLDYLDWNSGTSFDGRDSDWDGPDLDRLWYEFRWSAAQRAYGWGEPTSDDVIVRIGRQYVEFGTGLALSTPLDAVVLTARRGGLDVTGLLALSVTDAYNIDQTAPGDSREDRKYWGVELKLRQWRDHELFAYYFAQQDQDQGRLFHVGNGLMRAFGYDSSYVGAGSRGRAFLRDLQYTVEVVGEFGKSYASDAIPNSQNIHAWAFDTELRYVIQDVRRSQVLVEYLLASGDSDRYLSPTDTIGGNRIHTGDTSFNGWGFRNTGLALAPTLSNLGMVRLGASTFPLRTGSERWLDELQVGTDVFLYHKQQTGGVMSDSLSLNDDSFVGTGVDVWANWRLLSDVAWTVRYGIFKPGDAFYNPLLDQSYRNCRQQFFTGVTINF